MLSVQLVLHELQLVQLRGLLLRFARLRLLLLVLEHQRQLHLLHLSLELVVLLLQHLQLLVLLQKLVVQGGLVLPARLVVLNLLLQDVDV